MRIVWKIVRICLLGLLLVVLCTGATVLWLRYAPTPALPRASFGPITDVSAVPGHGNILVKWRETPEASGYQVFRSESRNSDFLIAGSPFGYFKKGFSPILWDRLIAHTLPGANFGVKPRSPFIDVAVEPGHTYYYRVRATDGQRWTDLSDTVAVTAGADRSPEAVVVSVDARRDAGRLDHIWETSIGSEHLTYMLNNKGGEHLRAANKRAHEELGVRYVTAHGVLNDDMGIYREEGGKPVYDFHTLDRVYDMVVEDGLKPWVQLSYMPSLLARNPKGKIKTYKANGSPPKDYQKWADLVGALAQHLVDRYGKEEVESWPFSVWNEPEICFMVWPTCYWTGTFDDYLHLYDYATVAIKSVDPKLRVGGPVTLLTHKVEPFLQHVTTANYATGEGKTPLDFLDVRIYSSPVGEWKPLLSRYGMPDLPVYYTEWGVRELLGDEVNDLAFGAAWIPHALEESLGRVAGISYWTASDYFEENGPPKRFFHGGFGLTGLEGVRKARYWAYYLLHQLGTTRLQVDGSGDGFDTLVRGLATRNDDGGVRVLLANATNDQKYAAGNPALSRRVSLTVSGFAPGARLQIEHYRVDNDHSNVYAAWESMGRPAWPSASQVAELRQRDSLQELEPIKEVKAGLNGETRVAFDLPMPGLSFVVVSPSKAPGLSVQANQIRASLRTVTSSAKQAGR